MELENLMQEADRDIEDLKFAQEPADSSFFAHFSSVLSR